MSDTLGEGTGDQAQANAQSTATSAPANGDLQQRLNGALAKIQSLTEANRLKDTTIAELQGQISKLHGDHAGEKAALTSTAGETERKLVEANALVASLKSELGVKDGTLLKLKLIRDNGMSGLLEIMDDIPNAADEAGQLAVLKRFQGFATKVGGAREAELLAGVTPAILAGAQIPAAPKDEKSWNAYIEGLPLGSTERAKAWDDYYAAISRKK